MPADPDLHLRVNETVVGVQGYFDLPLIPVATLLACWASYRDRRNLLLVTALVLFMFKHAAFLLPITVWNQVADYQILTGTAGWLVLTIYAATLSKRNADRVVSSST